MFSLKAQKPEPGSVTPVTGTATSDEETEGVYPRSPRMYCHPKSNVWRVLAAEAALTKQSALKTWILFILSLYKVFAGLNL